MHYFLMDLERTLSSGVPCFWKGNRYGYTYKIETAGIFPREIAQEIVSNDRNKNTVMISVEQVQNILGWEMKAHEG